MSVKIFAMLIAIGILSMTNVSADVADRYEFGRCEMCHQDIAKNFSTSMHFGAYGMMAEYEKGAAGHYDIDMTVFYEDGNCAKCHVANCVVCHTEDAHNAEITISTCDPCHGKKQTSLYVGDLPMHKGEGPHADIHYDAGLICQDCHTSTEMHGDGTIYVNQMTAVTTACIDCHISEGKVVNRLQVTQYDPEIEAHQLHEETVSCTACHSGWTATCVNCHLDTKKLAGGVVIDEFYLLEGIDGKVQPFIKQSTTYGEETHTGYASWFPHTTAAEPKDCTFCHENKDVLCEGAEGQIMGEGGNFISQDTIDRIYGVYTVPTPEPTPAGTDEVPGFGIVMGIIGLLIVISMRRQ